MIASSIKSQQRVHDNPLAVAHKASAVYAILPFPSAPLPVTEPFAVFVQDPLQVYEARALVELLPHFHQVV
jgi:hypothetical protein